MPSNSRSGFPLVLSLVEVMLLLVRGLHNRRIAEELGISARTVEVHKARVMEKTGAKTIVDLVRIADQAGRCQGNDPRLQGKPHSRALNRPGYRCGERFRRFYGKACLDPHRSRIHGDQIRSAGHFRPY